jgi:hypothetical protein
MVPLVFQFKYFRGKNALSEFFSKNLPSLKNAPSIIIITHISVAPPSLFINALLSPREHVVAF